MAALTKQIPRFLTTGRNSQNGLAGYLQRLFGGLGIRASGNMGTISIPNGSTSVVVLDAGTRATDLFFVAVMVKGANAAYFTGVTSITAGVSYTLNVNTDPGAGGVTLAVIRLPGDLLFAS